MLTLAYVTVVLEVQQASISIQQFLLFDWIFQLMTLLYSCKEGSVLSIFIALFIVESRLGEKIKCKSCHKVILVLCYDHSLILDIQYQPITVNKIIVKNNFLSRE